MRLMDKDRIEMVALIYMGEYGEQAEKEATRNVEYLLSIGDKKGSSDWEQVVKVIQRHSK